MKRCGALRRAVARWLPRELAASTRDRVFQPDRTRREPFAGRHLGEAFHRAVESQVRVVADHGVVVDHRAGIDQNDLSDGRAGLITAPASTTEPTPICACGET